ALGPRSVKGDEASSGVGLQIVVIAFFKLTTPDEGVAPANHRDLRREVPLGIEIVDRALPLAAGDVRVVDTKARRQRCTLGVGYQSVIGRWPPFLCHVESRVDRQAQVMEPADADIEISYGRWTEGVGVADSKALAASVLRAAILAKACAKWVLRQAQQLPVGKASEHTVAGVDVLVHAGDVLIHVPA